jgi:hypothetical protein
MKILSQKFRLETKWSHTSWRYVPEEGDIPLKWARKLQRYYGGYFPKMQTRIVRTIDAIIK